MSENQQARSTLRDVLRILELTPAVRKASQAVLATKGEDNDVYDLLEGRAGEVGALLLEMDVHLGTSSPATVASPWLVLQAALRDGATSSADEIIRGRPGHEWFADFALLLAYHLEAWARVQQAILAPELVEEAADA